MYNQHWVLRFSISPNITQGTYQRVQIHSTSVSNGMMEVHKCVAKVKVMDAHCLFVQARDDMHQNTKDIFAKKTTKDKLREKSTIYVDVCFMYSWCKVRMSTFTGSLWVMYCVIGTYIQRVHTIRSYSRLTLGNESIGLFMLNVMQICQLIGAQRNKIPGCTSLIDERHLCFYIGLKCVWSHLQISLERV